MHLPRIQGQPAANVLYPWALGQIGSLLNHPSFPIPRPQEGILCLFSRVHSWAMALLVAIRQQVFPSYRFLGYQGRVKGRGSDQLLSLCLLEFAYMLPLLSWTTLRRLRSDIFNQTFCNFLCLKPFGENHLHNHILNRLNFETRLILVCYPWSPKAHQSQFLFPRTSITVDLALLITSHQKLKPTRITAVPLPWSPFLSQFQPLSHRDLTKLMMKLLMSLPKGNKMAMIDFRLLSWAKKPLPRLQMHGYFLKIKWRMFRSGWIGGSSALRCWMDASTDGMTTTWCIIVDNERWMIWSYSLFTPGGLLCHGSKTLWNLGPVRSPKTWNVLYVTISFA